MLFTPPPTGVGDHAVTLHTGNGYGSVNTSIRRFSTVLENIGSNISYADSATLGALFTINAAGLYQLFYQESNPALSNAAIGATLNSLTATVMQGQGPNSFTNAVRIVKLAQGDLVRPWCSGGGITSTSANSIFSIRRVANV